MKVKELSNERLDELRHKNSWFMEQVYNDAMEQANYAQEEEFDLIGAGVFECHDHYDSFYLTCPRVYGGKAPEKLVGALNKEYLLEEDAKLYDELCELNKKMEDAEEWDEERPEYDRMIEIADKLAEDITAQLREYEKLEPYVESVLDAIEYSWIGDLEVEGDAIIEVVKHI